MNYIYILIASFFVEQTTISPFQEEVISVCSFCKTDASSKDDFHLAHTYFFDNKIDIALVNITKSIEQESYKNEQELFILYCLKGKILKEKKLYEPAVESLHIALKYANNANITSLSHVYSNLGELYFYTENFKKAVQILEAWKKEQYNVQSSFNASQNYHNLGVSYLHLKNYTQAEINLLESYELDLQKKDTLNLALSSLDIGNLYYEQYKDSLAISYFKKGLLFAEKSKDLDVLESALKNMSVVEENRKNFSEALAYRKRYELIKDSIYSRDKIWELAQKQKETAVAIHKERFLNEQQRKQNYILLALLLFSLVIIIGFFSLKLKKQKKNLDRLNRFKNDLFTVLGHDLRAPMHQLMATGNSLTKAHAKKDANALHKLLKQNNEIANTMYRLLDNLLQWIRLQDTELAIYKDVHNAHQLVSFTALLFKPVITRKAIQLQLEIPANTIVYTDQNMLKVIIRNLLDNAVKFTPKGGTISITAMQNQHRTVFIVKDNGIGIKASILQDIQQLKIPTLPNNTVAKNHGTGLGMRICHLFTDRLGGTLKIQSKEDVGTTIVLSLENKK
ncbi:ATP-binding protein [Kordia sp.]|uniref:ATP-binding protein n=1 Tax=Kordia sp. TaxID=1965332 RepID=UPI003D6BC60E